MKPGLISDNSVSAAALIIQDKFDHKHEKEQATR